MLRIAILLLSPQGVGVQLKDEDKKAHKEIYEQLHQETPIFYIES
jgi:hypothetical protein